MMKDSWGTEKFKGIYLWLISLAIGIPVSWFTVFLLMVVSEFIDRYLGTNIFKYFFGGKHETPHIIFLGILIFLTTNLVKENLYRAPKRWIDWWREIIFPIFVPTNESLAIEFSLLYNLLHPIMVIAMIIASLMLGDWAKEIVRAMDPKGKTFEGWFFAIFIFIILRLLYTLSVGFISVFISINNRTGKINNHIESVLQQSETQDNEK